MSKPNKIILNSELLRSRLKLKSLQSENLLKANHGPAVGLLKAAGIRPGRLRQHAARLLASGATASVLVLLPPQSQPVEALLGSASTAAYASPGKLRVTLPERLKELLPATVGPLNPIVESRVSELLHRTFGIHASADLEGNRLNTSYGYIGAEQHLPRYPGDSIGEHGQFQVSGLTPGRGAWGYFSDSKSEMTPQLEADEKYYVAVQTLYLSDWTTRLAYLRDWYKYRKVLVVNPKNGHAIVADVADSGPAWWTGKQYGGSPEVMAYLQMRDGAQKGPVLLFFVDDPENKVSLGPLEYNLENLSLLPL